MDEKIKVRKENNWKIQSFENNQIGLEEEFEFSCDQCGKCCKNQEDLMMSPCDIYRMAKSLDITMEEWIDLYGRIHVGTDSRLPIVRIKLIGEENRCPFLKKNLCSIQDSKPDVCAIFPLGRGRKFERDSKGSLLPSEVLYCHSGCDCGKGGKKYKVREWLDQFGLRDREESFLAWNQFIAETTPKMQAVEKNAAEDYEFRIVLNMVIRLLYVDYDTEKDFMQQFQKNMKKLNQFLGFMQNMKGAEVNG